jgi:hypothetical protein
MAMPDTCVGRATPHRAGGPIPWFSITLSIAAEDVDPDEVTRLLGVAPDRAHRKEVAWHLAWGDACARGSWSAWASTLGAAASRSTTV